VPRVRVDIILEEAQVQGVLEALKKGFSTKDADRARIGIWYVTDIQASGDI